MQAILCMYISICIYHIYSKEDKQQWVVFCFDTVLLCSISAWWKSCSMCDGLSVKSKRIGKSVCSVLFPINFWESCLFCTFVVVACFKWQVKSVHCPRPQVSRLHSSTVEPVLYHFFSSFLFLFLFFFFKLIFIFTFCNFISFGTNMMYFNFAILQFFIN